ncbi:alpha-amylase family glycosyl hydrolase, partial [Streptococcus pyogenes]
ISDYYAVDEQFGTALSLKSLINQAHQMGIKIIMDAVFNHSSDLHPYFQDVLENGRQSVYYDWYMINGEVVDQETVNYETFASVAYMPKWNSSNPAVQAYL